MNVEQQQVPARYLRLAFIGMIFAAISLSSVILGYKVIEFHHIIFSGAALVIPIRYMLGDVIAEIYGYYAAKCFIWYLLIAAFVFSALIVLTIQLPSPAFWDHQHAYLTVLNRSMYIWIYGSIGVIFGSILNIYLLSTWKLFTSGRYFWLRSIGASVIGELSQYVIVISMMYYHIFSWPHILELIFVDYSIQVALLLITSPFAHLLTIYLKSKKGEEHTETNVQFNPFTFKHPAQSPVANQTIGG